jgi:hypothetical protein
MFQKLDVFLPSGEEGDIYSVGSLRKSYTQSMELSKGPNRVGVFSPLT